MQLGNGTKTGKRIISALLAAVALAVALFAVLRGASDKKYPAVEVASLLDNGESDKNDYGTYRLRYSGKELSAGIRVPVTDAAGILTVGKPVELVAEIRQEGLYRLALTRQAAENAGADTGDLELSLETDGAYAFDECRDLYIPRQWVNASGAFETDSAGNQLLPSLTERSAAYDTYAMSRSAYSSEPLCVYLTAGRHTLTLTALSRDIAYQALALTGSADPYEAHGTAAQQSAQTVTIQAEMPESRSNPSVLELADRVSAATVPVCTDAQVLNTLGGTSWKRVGDSVVWKFTVAASGCYRMVFRCRQDYAGGISTCRTIRIDGKTLPGGGLLQVPYSAGFQRAEPAAEEDRVIWLEAGEHTLTLTATLGDMEHVINVMNSCMEQCNTLYRRIIMITGMTPDPYRDYNLKTKIPEVPEEMKRQAAVLRRVSAYLSYINQGGGSEIAPLDKLARQLELLSEKDRKIAAQVSTLNANISALGTWISSRSEQPLEIDWIQLVPEGGKELPVNATFFAGIAHWVQRLIRSYSADYARMGGEGEQAEPLEVWLVTGRDQAQIIERLCEYTFTPQYGIGIQLKLVQSGSVMSATMAGIGPDVSLMNSQADPINYAVRHAVLDLSGMDGIDSVIQEFYPSAMVPLTYRGGIYGLPETQEFPVLFYRRDILEELGLSVPQTWTDVSNMLADLQKNNMQFGMPTSDAYGMFLYQNNGTLYNNEGESSRLNSAESAEAFRMWTELYKEYQLPLSYDFLNRFRTGEVPLAIQNYSTYSSLYIFAPEIRDKWAITSVPGIRDDNGAINRSVTGTGTCAMIFRGCSRSEEAWTFLKWWVGEEAQAAFASEMEIRLGPQARVSVANKRAFARQLWTAEQSAQILRQWENVVGCPEVPGGYFLSRHVQNAFRKIVYQGFDRRETLTEYARIIDKELTTKRVEFGLE